MARRWTTANSNYLSAAISAALGDQWTYGGWLRPAVDGTTMSCGGPLNIGTPDGNSPRLQRTSTNQMVLQFGSSGQINGAAGAVTVANGWRHYLAVKRADNDRSLFENGTRTNSTTNVTNEGTLDGINIGRNAISNFRYWNGNFAHWAVWSVDLNDQEVLALAAGISPLRIRRGSLMHCWCSPRHDLVDPVGQVTATENGSWAAAEASEPPVIILPSRNQIIIPAAAAGGTTYTKNLADSLAVLDGQFLSRERGEYLSETALAVADEQYRSRERGRLLGDVAAPASDGQFLSRERGRLLDDGVAPVTDGAVVTRYINRVLTDLATVLDSFSKLITGAGVTYTVTLSDAAAIADGLLAYRQRNRHGADSVALSDGTAVSLERLRHLSEQLQITDTQLHFLLRTVQASDAVSATDGALAFRLRLRSLVDAFDVVDDLARTVTGVVPSLTVEVRVRLGQGADVVLLGLDQPATLGQESAAALSLDDFARLGKDDAAKLGGYN